jgi:hypothetical protein
MYRCTHTAAYQQAEAHESGAAYAGLYVLKRMTKERSDPDKGNGRLTKKTADTPPSLTGRNPAAAYF